MRIRKMFVKSTALLLLVIGVGATFSSCVDERYNLDNISPEVTIGGKEVMLPLGEIESKTLGEMLGGENEGLDVENGVYVLKFDGEGDQFTIDGFTLPTLSGLSPVIDPVAFSVPTMPTDFLFSRIETDFILGYPDMNVAPTFDPVEFSADINVGFSVPSGGANIPAFGAQSFSSSGSVPFEASFTMPEQIRSVGKIYFGENASAYGSPIDIVIAFNGVKSVNGGGLLDLIATFPSNYELLDEHGVSIGNVLKVEDLEVAAGVENVKIKAWLRSIDFSQRTITRGAMNIDDEISYSFDYDFEAVAGYCNGAVKPNVTLGIKPKFRDMEIIINSVEIDNANHSDEVVYTLNGIPESVETIEYIAFNSAPVKFRVQGMEWLKTDALRAETHLPQCLVFDADANGYLNTATNVLTAPMRQLENGVTLNLRAIDCSKCDVELKSGQLVIKTNVSSHISNLDEGLSFMLSEVLPPVSPVVVKNIIDESHFNINLSESRVSMREQYFDFKFDDANLPKLSQTIDVPDELASVERLEVKNPNGGNVKLRLAISYPENETFPVDKVYLSLSVNMKQMLHPVAGQPNIETAPNGDHILRLDHVEWRPNEDSSLDIIELELDAIEHLPAIVGERGARQIVIDEKFAVTGGVSVDAGTTINLETTQTKLNFDFEVDDIQISKFYGKIDYTLSPDNLPAIELGDVMGEGLKIENLDVNPIIRFNINNPLGVPFNVLLNLKPFDANGNYIPENNVSLEGVKIAAEGRTQLVLSTEARRGDFEGVEGVTFVPMELGNLFKGSLPSKVEVDLKVASDLSATHVLDLTQSTYSIGYDYAVEIPLEFGHAFDISYDSTVSGLKGLFEGVAEMPFVSSVGEVAIIADFTTTIPLDFLLETECLDENGNPTDVQVVFGADNMIHGHHPEDAEPEAHSSLVLKLDLGEDGSVSRLADIDALRFKLNLRNNSHTPSALSPDQLIFAKLRLRIRDGITLDFDKLPVVEE